MTADFVHHALHTYGVWVVGALAAIEYTGIPVPAETTLIAASLYSAATGRINIVWIVLAAAGGAFIGTTIGYAVGRWLGSHALQRYGRHIGLTPERLIVGRYLFARYGVAVIILGRFVALLRVVMALLAGANQMPWPRFLVSNLIGALAWASLYGFGAHALGHRIATLAAPAGIVLGVATACAAVAGVVLMRKHERRLLDVVNAQQQHSGP